MASVAAVAWTLATVQAGYAADTGIQPGDDFNAYANAAWLEATRIPTGRPRWTARDEINELTQRQTRTLLDEAASAASGSDARKVADFRAAYLDEAAIEHQGLTPLKPLLARIGAIHDKADLTRWLGMQMRADVDPVNLGIYDSAHLLGLSVTPGSHGEKTSVVFLLQGGLGLGNRESYLDPDKQPRRTEYLRYLRQMLDLAGFDHAAERADAVMRLETAIAQSHATQEASSDERNADNLWSRADFARQAPGIDWPAFLDAAGLARQESFVVWQPSAVSGAAELVASQPRAVWLDYLRVRAIDQHAAVLPHAIAASFFAIHVTAGSDATPEAMSGLIGRMYAQRFFPPPQKARVNTIVQNVISAFRRRVEAVTWMSPESKAIALAKLQAIYFGIGYPEKWPNYSTLVTSPVDAVGNLQRLAAWNYQQALARVGQPADLTSWWISPQTAGAVLMFNQNAYNFAAALLQPPKYDPSASDAMNYGAIGAIAGHEVSHFVDTLGADYDSSGRKIRWWTAADLAGYQAASAPLAQQFSGYSAFPEATLDGNRMLVENVADLAGLAAAFDAYRLTLGSKSNDKEYVRQQDRQFFIGFARAWRSQYREDALRKQVATDHAPERFRIATVRNLDAWYEAFDVSPGQRLYLRPDARVRIW